MSWRSLSASRAILLTARSRGDNTLSRILSPPQPRRDSVIAVVFVHQRERRIESGVEMERDLVVPHPDVHDDGIRQVDAVVELGIRREPAGGV